MKKALSLLLIFVIVFSLSACSNNNNTNNNYHNYGNNNDFNTEQRNDNYNNGNTNGTNNSKYNNTQSGTSSSKDSANYKTFNLGETWIVDGCWEFTINSVSTHYPCNSYDKDSYNKTNRVVVIDYTYKNLNFRDGSSTKLKFAFYDFSVSDANENPAIGSVPCTHDDEPSYIYRGATCNAQVVFAMQNNADISNVTIIVGLSFFADEGSYDYVEQVATFKCPVIQEDRLMGDKTNKDNNTSSKNNSTTNSDNSSSKEEPAKDETLWEYSEAVKLNEYGQKAYDHANKAAQHILKAASYEDTTLKTGYYDDAKTRIEYAKKSLNKAKELAEKNKDVSLTSGDYATAKEQIIAAIEMCDALINFDINETNYESIHKTFMDETLTLSGECMRLQAYSTKMVQSFSK